MTSTKMTSSVWVIKEKLLLAIYCWIRSDISNEWVKKLYGVPDQHDYFVVRFTINGDGIDIGRDAKGRQLSCIAFDGRQINLSTDPINDLVRKILSLLIVSLPEVLLLSHADDYELSDVIMSYDKTVDNTDLSSEALWLSVIFPEMKRYQVNYFGKNYLN